MFRIGHLCTSRSLGGLEINILRLMGWMNARGHENILLARPDGPIAREAAQRGLRAEPVAPRRKYFDRRTAALIGRIVERERLDALIVHPAADINLGATAKGIASNRPALLYLQHMEIGVSKRDFLHTWAYRRIDAWIVPLPSLRRNVLERTRAPEKVIRVIPLGIELGLFDPSRYPKAQARAELNLPANAFVAGVVGRLDEGKGQEHLIAALALLREKMPDLHLLIVGDETQGERQEYGARLRRLAAEAKVGERVHFRPFRRDVALAYAAMDLFCLTSLAETYGMVTLEAMAMRIPVIATASAGTPDIVRHESNGLLVPPRDPRALAEAIARLRAEPRLAQSLASQARRDVESSFSHARQTDLTEELLASLLSSKK